MGHFYQMAASGHWPMSCSADEIPQLARILPFDVRFARAFYFSQ